MHATGVVHTETPCRLYSTNLKPDKSGRHITKIIESVLPMRCPIHHKAPMVVVDGGKDNSSGFRVTGCCQKFVNAIAMVVGQEADGADLPYRRVG
jgi:hypothetical protein